MKRLFLSLALALGIFAIPIPSFAIVSSTTNTVQYSGDGYSTVFAFNNNVYLTTDLNVYEVTSGVSTLLTLNTNYTVTLTAISGVTGAYTASINLAGGSSPAGALAIGTTLVIVRNIPYTQLINISDYSPTPAATWNQAHDKGVILSQQLLNLVNRSILQSITATTPITFPPPVASNIIGWDVTGTLLVNYVPNTATYIALPLATSQGGTGSTSITFPLSTTNGGTGSTAAANAANGVVVLNSSSQLPAVSGALLTSIPAYPYVKVSETETSGTNGGTATSGSWITRVLNTKDTDTASIASLSGNQVTLPAGTYLVNVSSQFQQVTSAQIRLQNITAGTTLLLGISGYYYVSGGVAGASTLQGLITLAAPSALAVQYQVGASEATAGLGSATGWGTEVYTVAEFTKIG